MLLAFALGTQAATTEVVATKAVTETLRETVSVPTTATTVETPPDCLAALQRYEKAMRLRWRGIDALLKNRDNWREWDHAFIAASVEEDEARPLAEGCRQTSPP